MIRRHTGDGQRDHFPDRERCGALQELVFTDAGNASRLVCVVGAFGAAHRVLQDAVATFEPDGRLGLLMGRPGMPAAGVSVWPSAGME